MLTEVLHVLLVNAEFGLRLSLLPHAVVADPSHGAPSPQKRTTPRSMPPHVDRRRKTSSASDAFAAERLHLTRRPAWEVWGTLRSELRLLVSRWRTFTFASVLVFYVAANVGPKAAMYSYDQQYPLGAQRLHDRGHVLMSTPWLAYISERILAHDVPVISLWVALVFVGVPLMVLYEGHQLSVVHALTRFGIVCGSAHALRMLFFISTVLPGSADHCLHGPFPHAPKTLARIFALEIQLPLQASQHSLSQQCGDLIFSGHTLTVIMMGFTLEKYLLSWFLSSRSAYAMCVTLLCFAALSQGFILIATKRHYTVDVLLALYIGPAHWLLFERHWPDPPLGTRRLEGSSGVCIPSAPSGAQPEVVAAGADIEFGQRPYPITDMPKLQKHM